MRVAVLGASAKPSRYSYLAVQRLLSKGHEPIGVSPSKPKLDGVRVVGTLEELPADVHTLTMYVGPARSNGLSDAIVHQGFKRVIFNPGSENAALMRKLREAGVEVVEGCTLVMLSAGSF